MTALATGNAEGDVIQLRVALSFWGGFDVTTGRIVDRSHPSCGVLLTGSILVMPTGRGSSSASSVLAEAIRLGTAPAGIILVEPDPILAVGAIVAQKLYGKSIPIVVTSERFEGAQRLKITADPEAVTITRLPR